VCCFPTNNIQISFRIMKFYLLGVAFGYRLGAPTLEEIKQQVVSTPEYKKHIENAMPIFCRAIKAEQECRNFLSDAMFCLEFAKKRQDFENVKGSAKEAASCEQMDQKMPKLSLLMRSSPELFSFLDTDVHYVKPKEEKHIKRPGPDAAVNLAHEMGRDLSSNFNKIAPFGKEDTARELQDHAEKTQDTLVDAVENAEVAEIKRSVFRALTRLRAGTIKEFDTIARLETQAIDAYNDAHHYRGENPLAHLHEDEAPVETDKLKSFH